MVKTLPLYDKVILGILLLNLGAISWLGDSGLSGARVYLLQIFLFFFIALIRFDFAAKIKVYNGFNLFLVLAILLVVFFVISSFYVNLDYNLKIKPLTKLITYPIIIYLFFFSFSKTIFLNDNFFEKFINFWITISLFTSILGLFMMFSGLNRSAEMGGAALAYFNHPNAFSFIFTFAVPMVIYKYFNKKISLATAVIFLLILLTCLLFTYSRAGYIGVFITVLVLTFKRSKVLFIAAILILGFLAATFFLNFAFSKSDSSISRAQIMLAAYGMIMNSGMLRFLWGYGIFNNIQIFQSEIAAFGVTRTEEDPHNFILLLGIQYGMLLTITFVLLVSFLIIKAFFLRRKQMSFDISQKVNLSIAIVLGTIAQNMLEDIMIYPEFFVMPLFLIFLGYLYYSIYFMKLKSEYY